MATISISKKPISGSDMGQPIVVSATTGATTIHTTSSGTSIIDEVWLYAQNNHSQACELVLEFGFSGTGTVIYAQLNPRSGPEMVIPGFLLYGSNNAQVIKAGVGGLNGSASALCSQSQVSIYGYVNRMTQT